jgi:hypothetical protein
MINKLDFKFKKPKVNEKYKLQPSVQKKRMTYLQDYVKYKKQNRVFVWLDETWIFANGCKYNMWTDDTAAGVGTHKISDGKRYIVVHAGTKDGFLCHASLVFPSKTDFG